MFNVWRHSIYKTAFTFNHYISSHVSTTRTTTRICLRNNVRTCNNKYCLLLGQLHFTPALRSANTERNGSVHSKFSFRVFSRSIQQFDFKFFYAVVCGWLNEAGCNLQRARIPQHLSLKIRLL